CAPPPRRARWRPTRASRCCARSRSSHSRRRRRTAWWRAWWSRPTDTSRTCPWRASSRPATATRWRSSCSPGSGWRMGPARSWAAAGEALSRLRDEGVLREVQGGLEFRNELIRAQAYYAVAGPARRHLHRSVGEVLEGRELLDGQSPALEIAWHFLRASEPGRALATGLDGAKGALSVGAPSEAEQILAALLS